MSKKKKFLPDAYWKGQEAFLDKKKIEDNPYEHGTYDWIWWRRGWVGCC